MQEFLHGKGIRIFTLLVTFLYARVRLLIERRYRSSNSGQSHDVAEMDPLADVLIHALPNPTKYQAYFYEESMREAFYAVHKASIYFTGPVDRYG